MNLEAPSSDSENLLKTTAHHTIPTKIFRNEREIINFEEDFLRNLTRSFEIRGILHRSPEGPVLASG
jgi:hypothetical protein